jgi:hypothetical protein
MTIIQPQHHQSDSATYLLQSLMAAAGSRSRSSKSLRVPIDVTLSPQAALAVHSTAAVKDPLSGLLLFFSSFF